MAMALTMAGVPEERAKVVAYSMNQRLPTQTFVEVYGRSIRDQSLVTRGNLNIKGLDAMDWGTTKPNWGTVELLQTRRSALGSRDDRTTKPRLDSGRAAVHRVCNLELCNAHPQN